VEIEKLESFINRFGAKASKATQAQSKMKALEKLKAVAVEAPAAASSAGGGDAKSVMLRFPPAPPCFTDVITLQVGEHDAGLSRASALVVQGPVQGPVQGHSLVGR
jgi:ATPase subunit of ABC transporter with duplicated ATPase domains